MTIFGVRKPLLHCGFLTVALGAALTAPQASAAAAGVHYTAGVGATRASICQSDPDMVPRMNGPDLAVQLLSIRRPANSTNR
ncbi:hypothetical protein [Nocardia tengchongensis]|uniref:hypothetical protein n=1 Tax=Nocardia tengchongensis TaxID=2055889 RepID=UPI0036104968